MVPLKLPVDRGGWWHAYVCPLHGVELSHVGLTTGVFPPEGAPCRYGCRIDTPEVRGAWTVLAHQACARGIRELALGGDRSLARELLAEYAELYASLGGRHEGAAGWMLRGRLFHQALTEAVWAVTIGEAARALGEHGVAGLLDALAGAARAARAELVDQGRFASNYTAWLNAAGAVCSRDPRWLSGEHGVHEHVLAAVGEDGWEWEGSTYYHAFVLRAYLHALRGVPDDEVPSPVLERLRAMAGVLNAVTTPGGVLPALHDGPYARPEADRELAELRALLAERAWPASDSPQPVEVFRRAGYAVLRGDGIHAIVDFGPHGGAHGHRDKLALYLYGATTPWQPDPGQVPYGHADWRAYYASSAAHPTFTVDGDEQAECAGTLLDADARSVTVGVDQAYPGVRARRRVALSDGGLVDELTVEADRPRRVTCQLRPDVPLTIRTDGSAYTTWSGEETLHGEHSCTDPGAVLLARPGPGPADDPQRVRTHVDWTAPHATTVTFRSAYSTRGRPSSLKTHCAGTRPPKPTWQGAEAPR